jgi:hypothetical protein
VKDASGKSLVAREAEAQRARGAGYINRNQFVKMDVHQDML